MTKHMGWIMAVLGAYGAWLDASAEAAGGPRTHEGGQLGAAAEDHARSMLRSARHD